MASSSQATALGGKGRKKLTMAKIRNKNNLLVTFSKRRSGLFKKASELCTLTGAKVGLVIFSPGQKMYSFGHPSVHDIMNEAFPEEQKNDEAVPEEQKNDQEAPAPGAGVEERLVDPERDESVAKCNMSLTEVEAKMNLLRVWTAAIEEREREETNGRLDVDKMSEDELERMEAQLNVLRDNILRVRAHGAMPADQQTTSLHPVLTEMTEPLFGNDMGLSDPVALPLEGDLGEAAAGFPLGDDMIDADALGYVSEPVALLGDTSDPALSDLTLGDWNDPAFGYDISDPALGDDTSDPAPGDDMSHDSAPRDISESGLGPVDEPHVGPVSDPGLGPVDDPDSRPVSNPGLNAVDGDETKP